MAISIEKYPVSTNWGRKLKALSQVLGQQIEHHVQLSVRRQRLLVLDEY